METYSALLALCARNSPVTGEFPAQRPVTRSFDVFFHLRLNQHLSKQWRRRWFVTPSRPIWRHCHGYLSLNLIFGIETGIFRANMVNTMATNVMTPCSAKLSATLAGIAYMQNKRLLGVMPWKHFPHHRFFVRGMHNWPLESPHKGPVVRNFGGFLLVSLGDLGPASLTPKALN